MGATVPLPADNGDSEKEAVASGDEAGEREATAARSGRPSPERGEFPHAGQVMGFAGQLRSWRRAAGERRGRRVTQGECAKAIDRSERWYRDLERGAGRHRLDRKQCEELADLLQLDRDEFIALLLYNNLGTNTAADGGVDSRVRTGLRLLIDKQMPSPTYLCDANWNILGYNQSMAEWWPWVMQPGANLMRWALTSQEARAQYHDWHRHAVEYVRMLKFALAGQDSGELMELIGDVCKDPEVRSIWETCNELTKNRDGHVFRMSIPVMGWEPIDVVSHVLYPANMPDCRFVVITWWTKEEDETEHADVDTALGSHSPEAPGEKSPEQPTAAARRRIADAITGRLSVQTAEDAAALAGDDRIALPVLSRMIGPNCQLTLSPSAKTVIWAVQEADGEWGISEVSAYTLIVKIPDAAVVDEAREEMKHLTRAILPADPKQAVARIQALLPQLSKRIQILEEVWRDLYEEDRTVPYIWAPTDEI
ncbi:XRE family transcriptional regulator [Streptomyces sp. NPDC053253]|uniref:MmyB family transcriptional regulator n=1 Tax=Streptomyces sp. NPDC053253 TaxID=3365699 RepID=UPI0037D71D29